MLYAMHVMHVMHAEMRAALLLYFCCTCVALGGIIRYTPPIAIKALQYH